MLRECVATTGPCSSADAAYCPGFDALRYGAEQARERSWCRFMTPMPGPRGGWAGRKPPAHCSGPPPAVLSHPSLAGEWSSRTCEMQVPCLRFAGQSVMEPVLSVPGRHAGVRLTLRDGLLPTGIDV